MDMLLLGRVILPKVKQYVFEVLVVPVSGSPKGIWYSEHASASCRIRRREESWARSVVSGLPDDTSWWSTLYKSYKNELK